MLNRLIALILVLAGVVACGRKEPPGRPGALRATPIARPLEVYQQLGFMAGPAEFPAVASFATLAGPQDSSYVLFGLSLPASALRFQRDPTGFVGEYRISISFLRDSTVIKRVDRRESVRVGSFAETSRVDESIIFQDLIALQPGRYKVQVEAHDAFSSRGFRARDSVDVPQYGEQRRLAVPVLVYQAGGRENRGAKPDFVVNARKTVPYGADMPRIYIELYHATTPQPVYLRILDDTGQAVWEQQTIIE